MVDDLAQMERRHACVMWILCPLAFATNAVTAVMATVAGDYIGLFNVVLAVAMWHLAVDFEKRHVEHLAQIARWREQLKKAMGETRMTAEDILASGSYAQFMLLCEKHTAILRQSRANMVAANNMVAAAFLNDFIAKHNPESKEEFERLIAGLDRAVGMCCQLGEERMGKIMADIPYSTGDHKRDREDAMRLVPEVRPYDPSKDN